jgi:hypothetical protein
MATVETYIAQVPDWASQVEFVVHEPTGESSRLGSFNLEPEFPPVFLVAVVSTPNGLCPPFLDASIELDDPRQQISQADTDEKDVFVSRDSRLIIINSPRPGRWDVGARDGVIPYAVTVMAFHPAIRPNSPPSPGPTGASPFKCRACKITAKGLALAIVAAAALPAIPAALIIAVNAYLGVGTVVAAAFILSVLEDTADVIAEKLCKKVGLC